ncbi:hypothetical protein ABT144_29650 [Streptomyces sp. NPDC002039]|uniref:hypothetical protein n=1 Tax=Streptomyces sp. NPDC002039 TaxID=3154660 RepID=UPI00333390C6
MHGHVVHGGEGAPGQPVRLGAGQGYSGPHPLVVGEHQVEELRPGQCPALRCGDVLLPQREDLGRRVEDDRRFGLRAGAPPPPGTEPCRPR